MNNILKYDVTYEGGSTTIYTSRNWSRTCSTCKGTFDASTMERVEVRNIFFIKKELNLCKSCLRERKLKKLGF